MNRILRGLSSRRLPCGCLLGIYETYDGRVVSILDTRDEQCGEPRHQDGAEADEEPDQMTPETSSAA
jgi:hypothetical protein